MSEAIFVVPVLVAVVAMVAVVSHRRGMAAGRREMDARWSRKVTPLECVFDGGPADGKRVTLNALGASVAVPCQRLSLLEYDPDNLIRPGLLPEIGEVIYKLHGVLRPMGAM